MKVEEQAHRSCGQIGALQSTMERLHVEKNSIKVIHEPIYHVGGTRCLWMLVGSAVTGHIRGYPSHRTPHGVEGDVLLYPFI